MTRAPGAETAAPEDATPSLELRGIVKRFGGVAAVDHVSLAIAPGEVVALVGENGAGKSTLIQVACGLYRPDAGEVRAAGRTLPPGDPRASIAAGLGVVFQHFMLLGPLPVWENVILGREPRLPGLRGALGVVDRARARREVREAAERFGLQLDVDAEVRALGVGAQQRVEIVKQLWRGARVLILDEPTAVLSPVEADELIRTARAPPPCRVATSRSWSRRASCAEAGSRRAWSSPCNRRVGSTRAPPAACTTRCSDPTAHWSPQGRWTARWDQSKK
ncbi:MAG: hypothetical protein NVS2B9_06420 [Myxococcales bacterium]